MIAHSTRVEPPSLVSPLRNPQLQIYWSQILLISYLQVHRFVPLSLHWFKALYWGPNHPMPTQSHLICDSAQAPSRKHLDFDLRSWKSSCGEFILFAFLQGLFLAESNFWFKIEPCGFELRIGTQKEILVQETGGEERPGHWFQNSGRKTGKKKS